MPCDKLLHVPGNDRTPRPKTPRKARMTRHLSVATLHDSPESYGLIWHEKSRRFVVTSKGLHNTLEGARLHHIILPLERNARLRDYDCMMNLLFQAPVAGIRCLSVYQFFQALCGNLGQLTTSPKPRQADTIERLRGLRG